jgi:hypothetical protein
MATATAKIVGKNIVITLPMRDEREMSSSGKNLIVASTGSFQETEAKVNGKKVRVAANCNYALRLGLPRRSSRRWPPRSNPNRAGDCYVTSGTRVYCSCRQSSARRI